MVDLEVLKVFSQNSVVSLLWSRSWTFQLQVVAFREVFKVFPKNGVQQRLMEQNIVFQQRLLIRTLTFQFPEVSLFLALQAHPQYCVMCVETVFFAGFWLHTQNPQRFPAFIVVVVTCFVEILDDFQRLLLLL